MVQYSLALALYDYIPIVLFVTGLLFTARCLEQTDASMARLMRFAIVLVGLGGFCKATWKLLIAAFDINWMPLNDALFVLMAPGFTFIAFAIWSVRRQLAQRPLRATAWRCPLSASMLGLGLALLLAIRLESNVWFFVLLLQLTLANILFTWHAMKLSLAAGSTLAAALFVANIVGVFVMSGLARVGDPSEAFQWLAQISNTATQGSLALAGWVLWQRLNRPEPVGAPV
ncbi:hypothetical protein [Alkalimonas sp.]|uniref:hypothetical protein n=1 Tax=Alkalimonas sp. TaxID=1872453 RepID=UPI00263AEFC5|nr:hypothetical protein [Alkalimonas sp.]MCC5825029.1 hypothetical protein [Alkalimonas sp.]